jgi:transposase-like protein
MKHSPFLKEGEMRVSIAIRRAKERAGSGRRVQYGSGVRARAVIYYQRRAQSGASLQRVASELGLSKASLGRWVREEEQEEQRAKQAREKRLGMQAPEPVFHAVTVSDAAECDRDQNGIVLYGPGDLRVEGLAVAELAELLGRLKCLA